MRPKSRAPEAALVWLDPAQFARQMQPGRLKRLYYKAVNFAAPVLQHFRGQKTQIVIDSRIFAVSGVNLSQVSLGTPDGTNQTGELAWILSPARLAEFEQQIKNRSGVDLVNAPRVTLADGTAASVCVGQTAPGTSAFIGVTVDVTPKIVSHQFLLPMSAIYTELNGSTSPDSIRTNLYSACQAIVPNTGGILLTSPEGNHNNGTNYWIVLSPTAIDAAGNKIDL